VKAFLAIVLGFAAAAPTTAASPHSAAIDAALARRHGEDQFNGVALIARGGKVLHEAAYGARDAAASAPLRVDDRFNLGSIGKEFSAVAIAQLHERGKLGLDTPVARVLTDLPAWAETVNARHLLDYTSGVPDLRWRAIRNDGDAYADLQKVAALAFEPGRKFDYSYNNVMLRQFMVAKIAGTPFNDFVERRIFRPCRMNDAALDVSPDAPRVARAFNRDRKPDDTFMPIGGVVFATARDVLKWSECLHRAKVIDRESIAGLARGFNPRNGALGKVEWDGGKIAEHRHGGQSRNFEALMVVDLEWKITTVLLSNSKREKLDEIAAELTQIVVGDL
jgi:CubicO group peptidase (beta-lactamase class C family)